MLSSPLDHLPDLVQDGAPALVGAELDREQEVGGYALELFVVPPPIFLICDNCESVFKDPIKVCSENHHTACQSCWDQYRDESCGCGDWPRCDFIPDQCWSCDEEPDELTSDKFLARAIDQLEVYCSLKSQGCSWTGPLEEAKEHASKCDFVMVACPNEGCAHAKMTRASLKVHRHIECPFQLLGCPRGIDAPGGDKKSCTYLRKDKDEHEDKCQFWPCPVDECPTVGSVKMIATHKEYCLNLHETLNSLPTQREYAAFRDQFAETKTELAELEQECSSLEKLLDEESNEHASSIETFAAAETKIDELQVALKDLQDEKASFAKPLFRTEKRLAKVEARLSKLRVAKKIEAAQLKFDNEQLVAQNSQLNDQLDLVHAQCQSLAKDHEISVTMLRDSHDSKVEQLVQSLAQQDPLHAAEVENYERTVQRLESQLDELGLHGVAGLIKTLSTQVKKDRETRATYLLSTVAHIRAQCNDYKTKLDEYEAVHGDRRQSKPAAGRFVFGNSINPPERVVGVQSGSSTPLPSRPIFHFEFHNPDNNGRGSNAVGDLPDLGSANSAATLSATKKRTIRQIDVDGGGSPKKRSRGSVVEEMSSPSDSTAGSSTSKTWPARESSQEL